MIGSFSKMIGQLGPRRTGPAFPRRDQLDAMRAARQANEGGIVVAFHTPDAVYTAEARRMARSLELLGLPMDVATVDSAGEWVRNAGQKPQVLRAMRARHRGPLLYADVDAVFHRDPWPGLQSFADCDLAFHRTPQGELLSGTLLIADTPAAATLLDDWAQACAADPQAWDQRVLDQLLQNRQIRTGELPATYCWIFDADGPEPETVAIEHLQASREHGRKKLGLITSNRLNRRRRRLQQLERVLFD